MYDSRRACALNDAFRSTFLGGQVVVTAGVKALPDIAELLRHVREFTEFNSDNDPYKEHDFGMILHRDRRVLFKIDYFDIDMHEGSPDPADSSVTRRVLTVMLADEY